MARNTLKISTKGFGKMLTELDELGGNITKVATDALEQAAETIETTGCCMATMAVTHTSKVKRLTRTAVFQVTSKPARRE